MDGVTYYRDSIKVVENCLTLSLLWMIMVGNRSDINKICRAIFNSVLKNQKQSVQHNVL